jgi:hypothetical protein
MQEVRGIRLSLQHSAPSSTSWSATVAGEVPIDGGPTDAQGLGDRRHGVLPGAVHILGHLELETVQLPDDQGVTGAQLVQDLGEGGAVGAGAAGGLGEHAVAAGALQGVDLELGLLVGGGDAGIAEQMSHTADRCRTL